MRSNLLTLAWGYAILYAGTLVRLRLSSLESITPTKVVLEQIPNIKHLRNFYYKVLVPITPPHRTKMSPQRREDIYIACETPSIIRYLDLPTGNLLQGRFVDCFFDAEKFLCLVGQLNLYRDLNLNTISTPNMFPDPRTQECERGIKRILHLNQLADGLPDLFNNTTNVTKSHIHAANASVCPKRPAVQTTPMKRGRGKDQQPRKRHTQKEVRTVHKGVLPSIELDHSERETSVDST